MEMRDVSESASVHCSSLTISDLTADTTHTTQTVHKTPNQSAEKRYERSSFYRRREEHGNDFQITIPWSPQLYFSVRGAENFHIYLWIIKDLAWTQKWYVVSWIFGLSAISWCFVLVYHAFADKNYNEMYMLVALILWLSANFVWMAGELF